MKKCPNCKKDIPDSAKVCPYCKTHLEKGYKPMKRTNQYSNRAYILLALFLIFSPMLTTFLFGNLLGEEAAQTILQTPKNAITLGELNEDSKQSEVIKYYFGSLDDFEKLVTDSDKYVENIKSFEADIKTLSDKYGDIKMKKSYSFYITNKNNIYSELTYKVTGTNLDIAIDLEYDLTGDTNNVSIVQNSEGFNDFESLKIKSDSYTLFKELVQFISGNQEYKSFDTTSDEFNKLENEFNKRYDSLGNYGLGVSSSHDDIKTSMRVFNSENGYRFKLTSNLKADLDKLI